MGYDMHFERGGGTFRLNIYGMHSWALPHMAETGMIVDVEPQIPYPRALVDAGEAADEGTPEWEDAEAALERYRAQGVEAPGIPVFKLCSNDDWLVTPAECTSALEQYVRSGAKVHPVNGDLWRQWVIFITTAAAAGGFRVL